MNWVNDANVALLADLYEFTMAASYHAHGMNERATFDLFVRDLPEERNFLVCCGLDQALDYLENLRFEQDAIDHLGSLRLFDDSFLSFLGDLRFTGDVWAIAEGDLVFPREPLLRVTAPLIEAQIVETFLLNCMTFQTMVASKAARVAMACGERQFVDFSPRRDHGADAALKAARAAFVGGATASSNVLASYLYRVPVSGTMAHSYIMAFENELEAFRAFVRDFPQQAVLLIDTFDVEEGARRAVTVAKELASSGGSLKGVRIDSGDLAPLTRSVRKILDEAGLSDLTIVLSGDLDEYRIRSLLEEGVEVDAFGVGTQLGTSGDAPTLGGVYKLVADSRGPRIKLSTGKATLPGCKQVFRLAGAEHYERDVIALDGEEIAGGRPLLEQVMRRGRRSSPAEDLTVLRDRCRTAVDHLPPRLRAVERDPDPKPEPYPVGPSPRLKELSERMLARSR